MKRYLILLLLIPFISKAKIPLDSFFVKGATWCEYERFDPTRHHPYNNRFTYYIGNDTIINNHTYHLLILDRWDKTTIGCIRVDSQKVYFMKLDSVLAAFGDGFRSISFNKLPYYTDILLYDYNLKLNDNLKWKGGLYTQVINIDSIQLSNGSFIKRYWFCTDTSTTYAEYWLEGPGSTNSILGPLCYYWDSHNAFYYNSAISVANPNPHNATVCFPTEVENTTLKILEFTIFPNPLRDDNLQIETPKAIVSLAIVDVKGETKYLTQKLSVGRHSFPVSLETGVYFMSALFEDGTKGKKKLVKL